MGQEASSPGVRTDVQSPDGSGQLSVLSDSLDDLMTEEQFWRALTAFFQEDASLPWPARMVGIRVDVKVQDVSENSWITEIHVKTPFGWSHEECAKHVTDRQKRVHVSTVYTDTSMSTWKYTQSYRLWNKPLRLEIWTDLAAERVGDQRANGFMEFAFTHIMGRINRSVNDVKWQAGTDSPSGNGLKSIVTDPLDELLSPDEFWNHLLEKVKACGEESAEVFRINDRSYRVHRVREDSSSAYSVSTWFPEKDLLAVAEYGQDKTCTMLELTHHIQVHRSPFRVEYWLQTSGGRKSGPLLKTFMTYMFSRLQPHLGDPGPPPKLTDGEGSDVWEDAQELPEDVFRDVDDESSEDEALGPEAKELVCIGSGRIRCRVTGPTRAGHRTIITERLDNWFDFSFCQDHLAYWCKSAPQADMAQPWTCSVESCYECTISSIISSELAEQVGHVGIARCRGAPIITKSLLNPGLDMLFILTCLAKGTMLFHIIMEIKRFPLRIEAWMLDISGQVVANSIVEQQLRHFVSSLCAKKGLLPDE